MRREHLFLLRIWSDGDEDTAWRASLENVRSKETRHFESLDALQAFLRPSPAPQAPEPSKETET